MFYGKITLEGLPGVERLERMMWSNVFSNVDKG